MGQSSILLRSRRCAFFDADRRCKRVRVFSALEIMHINKVSFMKMVADTWCPVPSYGMFEKRDGKGNHTIGSAARNLKRLWMSYSLSGKYGNYHKDRRDTAYSINEIQYNLGLPLTAMVDSYDPDWVVEQLELEWETGR